MKKNIYHIQMGFSVYIRDDDKPDEDTLTLRAVRALRDVINGHRNTIVRKSSHALIPFHMPIPFALDHGE